MVNKLRSIADIIGAMAWLTVIGGVLGLITLGLSGAILTGLFLVIGAVWTSVLLWGMVYSFRMLTVLHDRQTEIEKRLDYLIKARMKSGSQ